MGNLEAIQASESPSSSAASQGPPSAGRQRSPLDTSPASKPGGRLEVPSNFSSAPAHQVYTGATSIPLSVPEIESETDVGAASPSPQDRGLWGPLSPPDDLDLYCPTPYQSLCVEQEVPCGPQEPQWGGACSISGRENVACFNEAVGRALERSKVPRGAFTGAPPCPHLAAATKERQKAIPPSLLALDELIKKSMGGPPVPGLHPNSPSTSPRRYLLPEAPRGSPVQGFPSSVPERGPSMPLELDLELAKEAPQEEFLPLGSTRDVSAEAPGPPGSSKGPLNGDHSASTQQDNGKVAEGVEKTGDSMEGEMVRFCCAHIVSLEGKLGNSGTGSCSSSNSNTGICPLHALKQLSPRLHECSDAISRTLLLQGSKTLGPLSVPLGASQGTPVVGPPSQAPLFSEASLGEVSLTLKRLQLSIDQFTSVLANCEGKLLSAINGAPFTPAPGLGALELGGFRLGPSRRTPEDLTFGEGADKSSGAPSSIDTTRAQMGSPLGCKYGEDEGPTSPIFFINREATTPVSELGVEGHHGAPLGDPENEIQNFHQQSSHEMAESFASLAMGGPSWGSCGGTSEGPSGGLSKGPSRAPSGGISGVPSAAHSDGSSADGEKDKGDKRRSGRALRWARERIKGMVPGHKKHNKE